MEKESESWGLVLAFPDESPSFTHGFEAGRLYELLSSTPSKLTTRISSTIYADNLEFSRRAAVQLGYDIEEQHSSDGFILLSFTKRPVAPITRNPFGLSIVREK
jgi:hypothetical protein